MLNRNTTDAIGSVVNRLTSWSPLSKEIEAEFARVLREHIAQAKANDDLVSEGDHPSAIKFFLSGWSFRYKSLQDGRRQIFNFLLPGDIGDLNSLSHRAADHSTAALTNTIYSEVPRQVLENIVAADAAARDVIWNEAMLQAAMLRERTVSLGRRVALERVAHLFCELFIRLQMVGLVDSDSYSMPATQTDLADVTGLSVVHLNRTLQELRSMKLIVLRDKTLTIPDFARLQDLALFDPSYLASPAKRTFIG